MDIFFISHCHDLLRLTTPPLGEEPGFEDHLAMVEVVIEQGGTQVGSAEEVSKEDMKQWLVDRELRDNVMD